MPPDVVLLPVAQPWYYPLTAEGDFPYGIPPAEVMGDLQPWHYCHRVRHRPATGRDPGKDKGTQGGNPFSVGHSVYDRYDTDPLSACRSGEMTEDVRFFTGPPSAVTESGGSQAAAFLPQGDKPSAVRACATRLIFSGFRWPGALRMLCCTEKHRSHGGQ